MNQPTDEDLVVAFRKLEVELAGLLHQAHKASIDVTIESRDIMCCETGATQVEVNFILRKVL